jgi:elongation factor P
MTMNELERGMVIVIDGALYEVLSVTHSHFGRGGAVVTAKLRNLKTGALIERNFKPADTFEETEIEKKKYLFLYAHRGMLWFRDEKDASERISLPQEVFGEKIKFLIPNLPVEAVLWNSEIVTVKLPIKVDLKVIEAPPSIRGDTAKGPTKMVKVESGAEIAVPLFIKEGDVIRVNTETGEYVERV